jgi:hypothetical protein
MVANFHSPETKFLPYNNKYESKMVLIVMIQNLFNRPETKLPRRGPMALQARYYQLKG